MRASQGTSTFVHNYLLYTSSMVPEHVLVGRVARSRWGLAEIVRVASVIITTESTMVIDRLLRTAYYSSA